MFKRLKIAAFSMLCAILSIALIFTSVAPVEAAKKVKMPTKVTEYELNEGKWVKRRYITYTYNSKGDCIKTSCTFYDTDGIKDHKATIKLKYT
ncbi:MAG: hypothetical protein J6P61_09540, partial [Erysipelotrichaceae bacterium]|nr:hypothetical protein [Erysipelotrichaceae bacterium]